MILFYAAAVTIMKSFNIRNDLLQVKKDDYHTAIARYNMTDGMVQESMESIRQWYKKQPHLPEGALTDDRLFRHMLAVGFSMEKLKVKIDNMLTARSVIPELMMDRDPCSDFVKDIRQCGACTILPQRLDDMARVFVLPRATRPKSTCVWDAVKIFYTYCDYRLTADISVGEHYIVDFKNAKLSHIIGSTPTLIKKCLIIHKNCFGSKIQGFHYVNVPSYALYILSFVKAVLSNKMADRMYVHDDYESLYRVIPKSILPSDFGGPNKSLQEFSDELYGEISKPEWREWFAKQDQLKSDESKRPGAARCTQPYPPSSWV